MPYPDFFDWSGKAHPYCRQYLLVAAWIIFKFVKRKISLTFACLAVLGQCGFVLLLLPPSELACLTFQL